MNLQNIHKNGQRSRYKNIHSSTVYTMEPKQKGTENRSQIENNLNVPNRKCVTQGSHRHMYLCVYTHIYSFYLTNAKFYMLSLLAI